jgi:CheY-like chemotaxis protein
MHGGTVAAFSDGLGKGTEVVIRLPVLSAPLAAGFPVVDTPQALPQVPALRILVADDNVDAATALSLQLELRGHEVRTVYDGTQAIECAQAFQPHVALLDLGMPKMDGYETAQRFRGEAWGAATTLIALTGWGQPRDRQRSALAGFDLHLVKPVGEVELFRALASHDADAPAAKRAARQSRPAESP